MKRKEKLRLEKEEERKVDIGKGRSKKCGDQIVEKSELWKLEKGEAKKVERKAKWRLKKGGASDFEIESGKARAMEIEMWRRKSKEKERKGRKDVFKVWNEKVLRIGEESDLGGEICSKWNGISSLLKIGGRMSRYGFCPIFINEKMSVV